MRPLVVTFTYPEHAREFARSMRRGCARQVSRTTVGARGEPLDHQRVAAWVEDADEEAVRQIAVETGGVVRGTSAYGVGV